MDRPMWIDEEDGVPFQDSYNIHQIHSPNFQWRPNFIQRAPPHWQAAQEFPNDFWCETCDRGFRTSDILEKHKQQHQKCNIDGCQFIAHPKVITKHIQMQHASGLYKKIAKLQDPEEIKKWREERKKKYPTKENVENAAAAIKEKIDRGEKLGLKNDSHGKNLKTGYRDKRKPYDNQKSQNKRFNNNSNATSKRKKLMPKNIDKKHPAAEESRKLKPFAGIQDLIIDVEEQQEELVCGFTIEDEDELTEASIPLLDTSSSVCLALTSLLCNYGSSDEEECDKEKSAISTNRTAEVEKPSQQYDSNKLNPLTKNQSDDDSGPEEVKLSKEIIVEPGTIQIKPVIHKRKPKNDIVRKSVFKRPKPKLPSTLLQKLLFKEMRQERNIVLQCIRHIVRNNFFDEAV